MKTEYPWQVNSVIHKTKTGTKTLGIDALLFSPKEEDEVRTPAAPLEMHEGYSRFKGTLIVKTGDKKVLTFNIPAKSVPYIHTKTKMLIEQNMMSDSVDSKLKGLLSSIKNTLKGFLGKKEEVKKESEEGISKKAYTVTFKTGTFKGKTPVAILLESDRNLDALKKQKKFLEDNVAKYPSNQEQIDAISEAIDLYEKGKLKETTEEIPMTSKSTVVYATPCKNIAPLDEEGRWTIYQITIKYNPENNLPFEIEVMNCFAPVDKTKGNEIVMSKAVKKQTQNIMLSEEEWYTMIDSMKATKIMFENLTYPEQLKLASKISKDNRDAAMKMSS